MATLYLTFGPTHSGKTTFGKRLYAELSNSKTILVDNDSVDAYLKDNFNNLRIDPDVLASKTPANPDLRLRIPQLISDYALAEGYNVIVTASHSKEIIRAKYREIAQRYDARVVLLIFDTSEEEVARRIEDSRRENLTLSGKSFKDLFQDQQTSLEFPTDEEKSLYSQVLNVNESNTENVLLELKEAPPNNRD